MLTKEEVKKYHAMEIKVKLPFMTRRYNAIVLASAEDGISIKHYPKNKAEVTYLLRDLGAKQGIEWAKRLYYDPKFCFIHLKGELAVNILNDVIKNGSIVSFEHGNSPSCPFA